MFQIAFGWTTGHEQRKAVAKRITGRTKNEREWVADSDGLTKLKLQSSLFHGFPLHPSYEHYSVHGVAITFEQVGDGWEKILYDSALKRRTVCYEVSDFMRSLVQCWKVYWFRIGLVGEVDVVTEFPVVSQARHETRTQQQRDQEARAQDSRDWSARWEAALLQSQLGEHEARNQMVEEVFPSDDDDEKDQAEREQLKRERKRQKNRASAHAARARAKQAKKHAESSPKDWEF